ncbi:MAG: M48 family metallopeptidase, partial [Erysipelotrichaceae bacterium]|nr:M48 family metallopeptidase [Erysipelotrichaceae bacterium]
VLAHECGHIACHHVLYRTMGTMILSGAISALGIGDIATMPIQIALAYWMRCSEYSADRAAMVCDGSADKVIDLCMRFAGYDKNIMGEGSVEAFMEQAEEYRSMVQDSTWNKSLEFLLFKNRNHPLIAVRAYEANEFAKRDRFKLMVDYVNSNDEDALSKLPVYLEVRRVMNKPVEEVAKDLYSIGFKQIKSERVYTGKGKEGNVITVLIDGKEFTKDNWIKVSDEVVLMYYQPKSQAEEALDHPDEVYLREGVKPFIGEHVEIAKAVFNRLGFRHVICEPMAMPLINWGLKVDTVGKVTIDGLEVFDQGDWFYPDATVVLYYYE